MISPDYVRLMARYNAWQNGSIYGAADRLTPAQRQEDRGAFFGSIQATLAHLLWADQMWMMRLCGTPAPRAGTIPESTRAYPDWQELRADRQDCDDALSRWAAGLDATALAGDYSWHSASAGATLTRPRWLLVTHMFNHQTHHHGQVHALLTAFGVQPAATDIPFLPE